MPCGTARCRQGQLYFDYRLQNPIFTACIRVINHGARSPGRRPASYKVDGGKDRRQRSAIPKRYSYPKLTHSHNESGSPKSLSSRSVSCFTSKKTTHFVTILLVFKQYLQCPPHKHYAFTLTAVVDISTVSGS